MKALNVNGVNVLVWFFAAFGLFAFVSMLIPSTQDHSLVFDPEDHSLVQNVDSNVARRMSNLGGGQPKIMHFNQQQGGGRFPNLPSSARGLPPLQASGQGKNGGGRQAAGGGPPSGQGGGGKTDWQYDDLVDVWSRSQGVWAPGFVREILRNGNLIVKYGIYEKEIEAWSDHLRPRDTVDIKWKLGEKVEVFSRSSKKWLSGVIIKQLRDSDANVIVEYARPGKDEVLNKKLPQHHKDLRSPGEVRTEKPLREFYGCDAISHLKDRQEWELKEGASHFKKTHFGTGILGKKDGSEENVFLFNYTQSQYNSKPKFHYDIMVEHYHDGIFDFPTMVKTHGFCDEGLWVMGEYFTKGNMQSYITNAKKGKKGAQRKYLPGMLVMMMQSIIDLNSKGVIMCDWKTDQWMVVDDAQGITRLNDVDSTVRADGAAEVHLKYCNCPFRFNPFYFKFKPREGWVNRTWGKEMWFKPIDDFDTLAVEDKPDSYEPHCADYHMYLRDELKLPLEQYWFQAPRAAEMIWAMTIKAHNVVPPACERDLTELARKAVRIWQPMSMNDLMARLKAIFLKHDVWLPQNALKPPRPDRRRRQRRRTRRL